MKLLGKIIRKIDTLIHVFQSKCRVFFLRLKYPGINLKNVTIEKNCSIIKENEAFLEIKNSFIKIGTTIHASGNSKISINGAFIGNYNMIVAHKEIIIDEGCEIAEFCVIRDQDHDLKNIKKRTSNPIQIKKEVWIGNKVTITKGVIIGDNTVIGANSVVTKSFESNLLIAGVPAIKIKNL